MGDPDRHFTLQEAQALVAWLQRTFDAMEPLRRELAGTKARVRSVMARMQSNGGASAEEELEESTRALHETQSRMDQHDLQIGLHHVALSLHAPCRYVANGDLG